ncbi:fasciclin domain-containing protein [Galbibacter mesophilus]|uniref:fasciclin domain-containing protein n=1 Tax=Galbibacter mesophilus TaxID=379069 RepID=UPI00191EB00F|nr:fasciclin domain-containing protein [Galbibacter mesophilus]MCM5663322.1 fasciclin domain-containing protein [Galbibacter mesophilus]
MKIRKITIACVAGALILASCADGKKKEKESNAKAEDSITAMSDSNETTKMESMEKDIDQTATIVGVAGTDENFSTLVTAVKAAGLVETLNGEGPFTVFAPTNAAFEKLPKGTVEGLLAPNKKADLSKILTYHVVPGKVDAETLTEAITSNNGKYMVETVQGGKLTATLADGQVKLEDAKGNMATVVQADVKASNGIIHAIDAVVMP